MNPSAKKSLGQNFLKSKKAIHQMIDAAETSRDDLVIEIGPGKGALTKPILETGAQVIAFELDQRMIDFLEVEFAEYVASGQLTLVHQDVLDIDMDSFFADKNSYKVIANIPYYITNAIIRKFLESKIQPTDMSLLMQKEVAERIVARDGKQSILSLSVAVFSTPRYVSKVSRKYFSPSPRVDSAIIHMADINHRAFVDDMDRQLFFTLVKTAFGQKRKKAINNLESLRAKEYWRTLFLGLDISPDIRAEDISLDQWLRILSIYKEYTV